MNGSTPRIEIFKPFGDAFELMKRILFRPFDLRKWCVIGFAAFLAGHFSGMGFNPSSFMNFPGDHHADRSFARPDFRQLEPWLLIAIGVGVLVALVLVIVLSWLKARGNFIFTDCIVRNRAAIAVPWREYRKEGNSYFLFLITVFLVSITMVAILVLVIFLSIPNINYRPEGTALFGWIIGGLAVFIVWMVVSIAIGLISYFMVPVMYIHRCRSLDAFWTTANLIWRNLGSFVLLVLFSIVLLLGLLIGGTILTCATCCMAALPYVGTVILLPAFVWLRAFGLLFLRQFGPEYDVWGDVDPLAAATTPLPPAPPIPPPLQT